MPNRYFVDYDLTDGRWCVYDMQNLVVPCSCWNDEEMAEEDAAERNLAEA